LQKKQVLDMEFSAAIHGIDIKNDKNKGEDKGTSKDDSSSWGSSGLFGDPESYKHLSPDEREELTQKMMSKMQIWAANKGKQ
jgi:hypothetical protein